MRLGMGAVLVMALAAAATSAPAQIASEADYNKYFDFIISHDWVCDTGQTSHDVQDGELNMVQEFHFQAKTDAYAAYRFTGNGRETMNIDGTKYSGTFSLEGFGFNSGSFGTGISIKSLTMTGGDRLPTGWVWSNGADLQLHLVEREGGYALEGYQNFPGGQITYSCGGK